MTNPSSTPRTDAAAKHQEAVAKYDIDAYKAMVIHARKLERELAAERSRAQDAVVRGLELHAAAVAVFNSSEGGTKPPVLAALRKLAALLGLQEAS